MLPYNILLMQMIQLVLFEVVPVNISRQTQTPSQLMARSIKTMSCYNFYRTLGEHHGVPHFLKHTKILTCYLKAHNY